MAVAAAQGDDGWAIAGAIDIGSIGPIRNLACNLRRWQAIGVVPAVRAAPPAQRSTCHILLDEATLAVSIHLILCMTSL